MKDVPDIAPEIRGLLEEIVANPRSAIRLAPRRALSTWFDTGETARASDIAHTKAERHLVEAHREQLAALLCEASWISYWKAPVLAYRPVGPDGNLYHPTEREPDWGRRATRQVNASRGSDGVELLRQCLEGIEPQRGGNLGRASLALVPRDLTRFYIALAVPWNKPRVAIALLGRFARQARPVTTRLEAMLSLAARTCSLGLLEVARDVYREAASVAQESPCARLCAFNLSCIVGEEREIVWDAHELAQVAHPEDPRAAEVLGILREWRTSRSESEREALTMTARKLSGRLPEIATAVCQEHE